MIIIMIIMIIIIIIIIIIVIIIIIIIIEVHFYTSYYCFSLDYLMFYSIQNLQKKLLLLKLQTSILHCGVLLS